MSKLEKFLKEYAQNAGITLYEQDVAGLDVGAGGLDVGMPPAAGLGMGPPASPAGPSSTVPGKLDAKKKEEEFLSSDEITEFVQSIKDALGIDPSTLDAAQKGDAFSEDITPENAKSQLAILRDIISQKTNPSEVETD